MKIFSTRARILLAVCAAVLIAAVTALYVRFASDTRVAFVNYPEYMIAPLLDQEINPAIKVSCLRWNDKSGEELKNYDCVIFFGMGLNFTEKQQEIIANLKIPVYTTASTKKETALAVMSGRQRETLRGYLSSGGKKNFKRMLDYIRYELDGKRINASRPVPPEEVEYKPFFHIEEKNAFKTLDEYLAWYKFSGHYKENAPRICLLSGNGGGALEELFPRSEAELVKDFAEKAGEIVVMAYAG